jgi:hypothetical protein
VKLLQVDFELVLCRPIETSRTYQALERFTEGRDELFLTASKQNLESRHLLNTQLSASFHVAS